MSFSLDIYIIFKYNMLFHTLNDVYLLTYLLGEHVKGIFIFIDIAYSFIWSSAYVLFVLFQELLKKESGNFIVSPFSAEVVLALTAEGARGQTAKELITGLSLPSTQEKTQKALKAFLPKLKPNNIFGDLISPPEGPQLSAQLQTANKIYAANDIQLEPEYNKVAVDVYQAGKVMWSVIHFIHFKPIVLFVSFYIHFFSAYVTFFNS